MFGSPKASAVGAYLVGLLRVLGMVHDSSRRTVREHH